MENTRSIEPQQHHRTKVAVREMLNISTTEGAGLITISSQEFDSLLTSLVQASQAYTTTVQERVADRARILFKTPTPSPEQKIKTVFSHRDFGRTKGKVLEDTEAMRMVDRALKSQNREIQLFCTGFPMKVFNPLETNYLGDSVDLGDVSVLLRFAELAAVLTHFGKEINKKFSVVIVSDGRMNEGMFKVDPRICDSYVVNLNGMISRLGISSLVSVREFSSLLSSDKGIEEQYVLLTKKIKSACHAKFDALLNPDDLGKSIESALKLEYDNYQSSSFGHLFHSTIGSVRYDGIELLSRNFGIDFLQTYSMILESILWDENVDQTKLYEGILASLPEQARASFADKLQRERSETLKKAWHSTVEYFAVLEANKETKVFESLFHDGVRITTRPKQGQIGVHTSDQSSPELFSYHSVPVVLPCNKGKNVKIDFQLRITALGNDYLPVLLSSGDDIICYIHPDVTSMPIDHLPWRRGRR